MRVQVKIGTTQWESLPPGEQPRPGFVVYDGDWVNEGFESRMVWDPILSSPRPMTLAEITALPPLLLTNAAKVAKAAAEAGIQAGDDIAANEMFRALAGVVLALRDEVNRLRQAIPHRIVSIARTAAVATATTDGAHGLAVGAPVAIAGADLAAYNLTTLVVATPTATTFTYAVVGTPATPAAGSIWYTRGSVTAMMDITDEQLRAAVIGKIRATAQ